MNICLSVSELQPDFNFGECRLLFCVFLMFSIVQLPIIKLRRVKSVLGVRLTEKTNKIGFMNIGQSVNEFKPHYDFGKCRSIIFVFLMFSTVFNNKTLLSNVIQLKHPLFCIIQLLETVENREQARKCDLRVDFLCYV